MADFGIGETLLANVATGALVGGGISALTGGDFLTGALTGGIGGGIKGFMPDFTKIFSGTGLAPASDAGLSSTLSAGAQAYNPAQSIATSPFGTTEAVSATSPAWGGVGTGTVGTSGISNLATSGISPDVLQAAQNQAAVNAGQSLANTPSIPGTPPTSGTPPVKQPVVPQPTDYSKLIQENNLKPVGLTTQADGPLANGNYALNGKVYSGSQVANLGGPQSFFEKYKTPLLGLGALAAYKMSTAKPTMAPVPVPATGALTGKYNLASNYQPLSNPTPVYPRFAEGGIASLASGGNMVPDKVNVDFMHGDMYPMSQQNRAFYATPTQMPTSAQQTMASYEPKTNPLTGQATANMASGGPVSFASGGNTGGQVYYDANKGQYYTIKDSGNPVSSVFNAMGAASMGGFGGFGNAIDSANRDYIGASPSNPGSNISPDYQASSVTPRVYQSSYADVPQATPQASTVAVPQYSLQDSANLLAMSNPDLAAPYKKMASGGISSLGGYSDGGRMLKGPGDGMSDSIPGMIANKRPARLAEGEFVVPADVVSHLGNGSTDAGAKQLYAMMNKVRQARTGSKKQGKQINPRQFMLA
jgi:hypothetical protein